MPTPEELLATAQSEGKALADEYNEGVKSQNDLMTQLVKKQGEIEALQKLCPDTVEETSSDAE